MRLTPSYPIDRYLVESSKNIEMTKILDDDIWNEDPLMRPEDEILLRKLQDMLQTTAEQLKELSEDLQQPQRPRVLVKSLPTPLDEEFNEKVHIEEIVKAKFNGQRIVESSQQSVTSDPIVSLTPNITPLKSKTIQVNTLPAKIPIRKKLERSKTRLVHIDEGENLIESNNEQPKKIESVCYSELTYKCEPKILSATSNLQVQHMPSVNIRSELKQQKVLQVDIMPESKDESDNHQNPNVVVVQLEHKNPRVAQPKYHQDHKNMDKTKIRKVTRMSTCESSESFSPITRTKLKVGKTVSSNKSSARSNKINRSEIKKDYVQKRPGTSLDEWKRKLNSVYGQSSKHKKKSTTKVGKKPSPGRADGPRMLNNGAYVPYSQLTLGGVRLSDIEDELSDSALMNDAPLSELLDKILGSKQNSPRKENKPQVVLSKSDEDLINEVLDIENKVDETLSKDVKKPKVVQPPKSESSKDSKENENYDDDFEAADKSENTTSNDKNVNKSPDASSAKSPEGSKQIEDIKIDADIDVTNSTFTKRINLSLKRTVDVYECLHAVQTRDSATQSRAAGTSALKETQTSPDEDAAVRPIRNALWTGDPRGEIQAMFQLEKDFIKRLLIDEYRDVLGKPSTSAHSGNVAAAQKHTQTSPGRAQSAMTSPARTHHRMTSPLAPRPAVDRQTSPRPAPDTLLQLTQDLDISINLSSPRFNLRLPRSSSEVVANFESRYRPAGTSREKRRPRDATFTASSSTTDVEMSSDISSLGEVTSRLRRKLRRMAMESTSGGGSSSSSSDLALMLQPRSEGEVGSGARRRRGGSSLGQL